MESEDTPSESSDVVPLPSISVPLHSNLALPPKASTPLQMDDLDTSSRGLDDDDDSALPLVAGNPESVRLETKLDAWCLDLKRNVLVSQSLRLVYLLCVIYKMPTCIIITYKVHNNTRQR